jgi:hypothetical protein
MKKLLTIIACIILSCYFLLTTNNGLRLGIKAYAAITNQSIQIKKIHNNFPKTITLQDVTYNNLLYAKAIYFEFNKFYQILSQPIVSIQVQSISSPLLKSFSIESIFAKKQKLLNITINNITTSKPIKTKIFINCKINNNFTGSCHSKNSLLNNQAFNLSFNMQETAKKLNLSIKQNSIEINKVDDMSWKINLTNLQQIIPTLTGYIVGQGSLKNKKTTGNYKLTLHTNNLDIHNANIITLKNKATFNIEKIKLFHEEFNNITANINSSLTINRLDFYHNQLFWQLTKPSKLKIKSINNWQVESSCIHNHLSKICAKINHKTNFEILFNNYPLKNFNFFSQINISDGYITGKITQNKTLNTNLNIAKAIISTPFYPTPIKNIYGSIKSSANNKLNIKLFGLAQNEKVQINASLNKNLHGKATLQAHNIFLFQEPYLTLVGNPNISLQINDQIHIQGEINVTKASFNPNNIVNTLPAHTIIKGTKQLEQQDLPFIGTLKIKTQHPIDTKIYGLNGKLSGELMLYLNPNKPILTSGELKLLQPKHHMLNELNITSAKIFYQNSPIYSPYININLNRKLSESWQNSDPFSIANVTVGVKIFGNLFSPSFSYYSSPIKMQKNQIISSLIAGHQTNTIMPYQAVLFSIGVSSSNENSLLNISNTLSNESQIPIIDNIQFISNEDFNNPWNHTDNNDTSILITKQISPKIGLNYLFSLLDNLYEISLNTKLNNNTYSQLYKQNIGAGINILRFWK